MAAELERRHLEEELTNMGGGGAHFRGLTQGDSSNTAGGGGADLIIETGS